MAVLHRLYTMLWVVLGVVASDLGFVVDFGVDCGVCATEFGLGVGFGMHLGVGFLDTCLINMIRCRLGYRLRGICCGYRLRYRLGD